MELARSAKAADRAQLTAIWRACFRDDSEAFVDWFFENRFSPALTSCLELDGSIVSALYACPMHARIRDKILPASMLSGVATLPGHEGRGYMRRIFLRNMQSVRAQGIPIVLCTPVHPPVYFSFGHFPATDTLHLTMDRASAKALPAGVFEQPMNGDVSPLHACYQRAFLPYSGVISRSLADFELKLRDYASDGARCLALWNGGWVRGYCVFFESAAEVYAEEVAALDDDAYATLMDALCHASSGRALDAKLPSALSLKYPAARLQTRPQGMMGVADVSLLLSCVLCDGSLRFDVRDDAVPQNAGVWDGAGKASSRPPHFSIDAGRLGQLLCGYASASELAAQGLLAVHDDAAMRELVVRLPKLPCYIVDEY